MRSDFFSRSIKNYLFYTRYSTYFIYKWMFCLFSGKYWSYQYTKRDFIYRVKNTLRQAPWKSSYQSLYPDQFYYLTQIQSRISMFIYNILFCRRGQAATVWLRFFNQKDQVIQPVTFPATLRQAQQKSN